MQEEQKGKKMSWYLNYGASEAKKSGRHADTVATRRQLQTRVIQVTELLTGMTDVTCRKIRRKKGDYEGGENEYAIL